MSSQIAFSSSAFPGPLLSTPVSYTHLAREYGLLGDNVLGTGFKFDLDIRLGAGAFVCGEETALMTSIEGNRGEPRLKPPFPAVEGLFGKPTILNNVETLSNIPQIITKGPEWFSEIGTEKSHGTKVFEMCIRDRCSRGAKA